MVASYLCAVVGFTRVLAELDKLSVYLVLDESVDVLLLAEVPYLLRLYFHGVHVLRIDVVLKAVALLNALDQGLLLVPL